MAALIKNIKREWFFFSKKFFHKTLKLIMLNFDGMVRSELDSITSPAKTVTSAELSLALDSKEMENTLKVIS